MISQKKPYNVMQIAEDLFAIQENSVRCFLLIGREAALLIDTGFGTGNLRAEVEKITKLPVIVANTHSDPDHIGANLQFERAYLHTSEFSRYRDIERNLNASDSILTESPPVDENAPAENEDAFEYSVEKPKDKPLTLVPMWESDFINIGGGMLEVILLPGHTPGSVAFLERNNGILFAGDTVLSDCVYMFNDRIHRGRNMEAYVYSLEKLLCMKNELKTIYCSHQALTFPVNMIEQLAKGARQILEGEIEGHIPSDSPYAIYDIGVTKVFY
ncbi:MAG: MBL fold metallo-hydrolase [Oscillospiraceae bacterium]|nr:MBL fold metallo-hydrolase [Oscillospiraceae bacterium]